MEQYLGFKSCLYSFYFCLPTNRRSFDDAQSRLKCRKLLGIGGKEPSKVSFGPNNEKHVNIIAVFDCAFDFTAKLNSEIACFFFAFSHYNIHICSVVNL